MRPIVSVQRHATRGATAVVRHLYEGQSVRFGTCGCAACGNTIVLTLGGEVSGRVTAYSDHWRLDNLSPSARLVVMDCENAHHLVSVPAGRAGVVLPFEIADVVAANTSMVTVFGPEPTSTPPPRPCPATDPPAQLDLRHDAVYFAVLVALCEPFMRGHLRAPLPTSAELAEALNAQGLALTPSAVDAHIAYLIEKLGMNPQGGGASGQRGWRKVALAMGAIRGGLVAPEDLPTGRAAASV